MAQLTLADAALGLATSGIGTVVGAFIGYRLAISAHVREKRHDFLVEQLRDFYAPMLALGDDISMTTDSCWDIRNSCFDPDCFHKHVWQPQAGIHLLREALAGLARHSALSP